MNDGMEGLKNLAECSTGWQHWIPFAALTVRDSAPPNRPLMTRIMEQAFVAVIAGGGAAYGVNDVVQARQEEQIKHLQAMQVLQVSIIQEQMRASESRLTAQIVELRARQLK